MRSASSYCRSTCQSTSEKQRSHRGSSSSKHNQHLYIQMHSFSGAGIDNQFCIHRYMNRRCDFLDSLSAFNFNMGQGEYATDNQGRKLRTDTRNLGSTLMTTMLKEVEEFCDLATKEKWSDKPHQQVTMYEYLPHAWIHVLRFFLPSPLSSFSPHLPSSSPPSLLPSFPFPFLFPPFLPFLSPFSSFDTFLFAFCLICLLLNLPLSWSMISKMVGVVSGWFPFTQRSCQRKTSRSFWKLVSAFLQSCEPMITFLWLSK